MHLFRFLILFFGISIVFNAEAQLLFKYNDSVTVKSAFGADLTHAWYGGFNTPQFSQMDLDDDNVLDLVIFDKNAKKTIVLLNKDGNYQRDYYREQFFPEADYWMIFRDYNNDGKPDAFIGVPGGIAIYKNTSTTENISFEIVTQKLLYTSSSGFEVNVYNSTTDIPGIDDLDGDGDIDILAFGVLGGKVEWYENLAAQDGDLEIFKMERSETCWGRFEESPTDETITLNACGGRSFENSRHTGSSTLILDANDDALPDVLIGDISGRRLTYLENTGSIQEAVMTYQDALWPSNDKTLSLQEFPVPFAIDEDLDGDLDIVVSNGNQTFNSTESSWLYENRQGVFLLKEKGFLQGEMLDFGIGAKPKIWDYDGDGLNDILIANKVLQDTTGGNPFSSVAILKNIGTKYLPSFQLVDTDWSGLSSLFLNSIDLAIGDIDGDEIEEVLVGEWDGYMHLLEWDGSEYILSQPRYLMLSSGGSAAPELVDVDGDGDLDLFVGRRDGTIDFYANIGDSNNFNLDTVITNFKGLNVKTTSIYGTSVPSFFKSDTALHMVIGSETGELHYVEIQGDSVKNVMANYSGIYDGKQSAPALGDLNADGWPELIVGNRRGGLSFYSSTDSIPSIAIGVSVSEKVQNRIKLYPNPSSDIVRIEGDFDKVEVYNCFGQKLIESNSQLLDLGQYRGLLLVKVLKEGELISIQKVKII